MSLHFKKSSNSRRVGVVVPPQNGHQGIPTDVSIEHIIPYFGYRERLAVSQVNRENRELIRTSLYTPKTKDDLIYHLELYHNLPLDIEYENQQRERAGAQSKNEEIPNLHNQVYNHIHNNRRVIFDGEPSRRAFDEVMGGNWREWDVSNIKDMNKIFTNIAFFNEVVPWDVSHVTNMSHMFHGCGSFNQPLPASFNTSNVTDMSSMFDGCERFNQPLPASFNTSNVTDMSYMFSDCSSFNQPLPLSFITSNVTNMRYMFAGCSVYNKEFPFFFQILNDTTDTLMMFEGCEQLEFQPEYI